MSILEEWVNGPRPSQSSLLLPKYIFKISYDLGAKEDGQRPFDNKIDEENNDGFFAVLFVTLFEEINHVHRYG